MKKIILSCALTGATTNRSHCPAIPYTPKEISKTQRHREHGVFFVNSK